MALIGENFRRKLKHNVLNEHCKHYATESDYVCGLCKAIVRDWGAVGGSPIGSGFNECGLRDILGQGWGEHREGAPVLPGTLLHRPRPERVTPQPEEALKSFTKV